MAESPTRGSTPALVTAAATAQAIYTAGALNTWAILRDITIVNESTSTSIVVTLGINTSAADAAGKRIVNQVQLQPNSAPYTWGGFLPLIGATSNPDLIYAVCDKANLMTVTLGIVTGP